MSEKPKPVPICPHFQGEKWGNDGVCRLTVDRQTKYGEILRVYCSPLDQTNYNAFMKNSGVKVALKSNRCPVVDTNSAFNNRKRQFTG